MNYKLILALCLSFLILACGKDLAKKPLQRYVVKQEILHKKLFFTGTVQPLSESALISPMDAVLETMHAHYGDWVRKEAILITLNSTELQKQYNETLTEYLKAKDSYTMTKLKFTGTQELWKAGLLSKNNYLSEKSNLDTARISLMQATTKLSDMLEKMDESSSQKLSALNIAEFDKVRQALTTKHNLIQLKALNEGVMLYPPKNNEDKTNQLHVGSMIKSGQVLALIGDLTGIRVEIDVAEVDIDKIHRGMPATITGVALGKEVLHGKLVSVNAQATNTSAGGLPSFSAVVEVRNLTKEQQAWIKVGMSASIELDIDMKSQLTVPIAAVKQEKGKTVVQLKDPSGALNTREVSTSVAQADKVTIIAGLQAGDEIAYD